MAWVTLATTGMRHGNMYFQYDDSQGTTSRYCRLYFEFYSGTYGDWILRGVSINGSAVSDIRVNSNGVKWSGWLDAGYRSWWAYVNWWDIGYAEYSGGGTVPSGASAPTGLNVTNLSTTKNSVTGTVSITGWGNGANSNRYLELNVSSDKTTNNRRYQAGTKGDTATSKALTVNNSSSGNITLSPNSKYYIGAYANNGSANTGVKWDWGTVITKPDTPSACSLTVTGENTATLSVTSPSQGNAATMTVYYKLNSGSYASMGTITSGGTITKSLTGLTAGSNYTATVKITTSSGDSGEKTSSQVTTWKKPQGVTASLSSVSSDSATINVSISNYGIPASESSRYIEGEIGPAGGGSPYRYTKSSAGATSATVTVNSSSPIWPSGSSLTISPNTKYAYRGYANNKKLTNTTGWVDFITKPATPTTSASDVTNSTAIITITSPSQGTAATMTAYYKIGNGDWVSAGTITSGSSVHKVATGLSPNTQYTITAKITNSAGDSGNGTATFETTAALYGPSPTGFGKHIIKLYGSVDGKTKLVKKYYGSANGQSKKIF